MRGFGRHAIIDRRAGAFGARGSRGSTDRLACADPAAEPIVAAGCRRNMLVTTCEEDRGQHEAATHRRTLPANTALNQRESMHHAAHDRSLLRLRARSERGLVARGTTGVRRRSARARPGGACSRSRHPPMLRTRCHRRARRSRRSSIPRSRASRTTSAKPMRPTSPPTAQPTSHVDRAPRATRCCRASRRRSSASRRRGWRRSAS